MLFDLISITSGVKLMENRRFEFIAYGVHHRLNHAGYALSREPTAYDEGLEQRRLNVRYLVGHKDPGLEEISPDLVAPTHR